MPNNEKEENNSKQKTKAVQHVTVTGQQSGRRIDNFLQLQLKGLPKTRIYKMLRKGEVRLNGSRVKQNQRIEEGDVVRIPPVSLPEEQERQDAPKWLLEQVADAIFYEDERLLVINKPSGLVVHSGSGQQHGVIECLRQLRPNMPFIELAHRLDRDTSGCLILAKEPDVLREIQQAMKSTKTEKHYLAFVKGNLAEKRVMVDQPLKKGAISGGERIVRIDPQGKKAKTLFQLQKRYQQGSLLKVTLLTGRTHQIRVHASHLGQPLAMDGKYGDKEFNKTIKKSGLKRLFLHASEFRLTLPSSQEDYHFQAPLPEDLQSFLNHLDK